MKVCANETCSHEASNTYCSRECQLAARREGAKGRHRKQVPDLWVTMDQWWALDRIAYLRNMTIADVVMTAIESETGVLEGDSNQGVLFDVV